MAMDEVLDLANEERPTEPEPRETYQVRYTKAEFREIDRLLRRSSYEKPLLIFLLVFLFFRPSGPVVLVVIAAVVLLPLLGWVFRRKSADRDREERLDRICASTYEYQIFDDHISATICHDGEETRARFDFADIERIEQLDKWLLVHSGGTSYIIRKNELQENSVIYSFMYQNPAKVKKITLLDRWRIISILLFIASLLSIWGALTLVAVVSEANGLFVENMWLFFVMTPIPIASIMFGRVLKKKGYPYKKNIIVGIVMTLLLCVYGAFIFIS